MGRYFRNSSYGVPEHRVGLTKIPIAIIRQQADKFIALLRRGFMLANSQMDAKQSSKDQLIWIDTTLTSTPVMIRNNDLPVTIPNVHDQQTPLQEKTTIEII